VKVSIDFLLIAAHGAGLDSKHVEFKTGTGFEAPGCRQAKQILRNEKRGGRQPVWKRLEAPV